jgi:hypothetical protein
MCLSFNCYNISICKKEKRNLRNLKKFVKPIGPYQFHEFSLDVSSLIVATSAFEKKGKGQR